MEDRSPSPTTASAEENLRLRVARLPAEHRKEARELLDLPDRRGGQLQPDGSRRRLYHAGRPAELLYFFHAARDRVKDPERVVTKNGRVEFVAAPMRIPSFAGWAAEIGVAPETVSRWAKKHPAFGAAVAESRGVLESILLELASIGAIDHRWAQFLLRCNHNYTYSDRLEVGGALRLEAVPASRAYLTTADAPPGQLALEAGDDD